MKSRPLMLWLMFSSLPGVAAAAGPAEDILGVGVVVTGLALPSPSLNLVGTGLVASARLPHQLVLSTSAEAQFVAEQSLTFDSLQGTIDLERRFLVPKSEGMETRVGVGLWQNPYWGTGFCATATISTPALWQESALEPKLEFALRVGFSSSTLTGEMWPLLAVQARLLTWM